MWWRILVGFSVALLVGEASAKEVAAMGAGTSTCAQFAIRYRASPELVESEYYTWAQGFMSARNVQKLTENRSSQNLDSIPTGVQKMRLRTYCDNHPLAEYLDAIMDLYDSFSPNAPVTPHR
jgi:hypothetical protein